MFMFLFNKKYGLAILVKRPLRFLSLFIIAFFLFIVSPLARASITTLTIDGTKTFTSLSSPLGGLNGCGISSPGEHSFTTIPLVPLISGRHTLETTVARGDTFDTFLAIYSPTFDPNNPTNNLIACNDDGGIGLLSKLSVNLDVGTQFVLVVTNFRQGPLTGTTTVEIDLDVIFKMSQIINFVVPETQIFTVGDQFDVSASSDSGLAVDIVSETNGICTLSGNTVSLLKAGRCQLTASQAGNNRFAQASVSKVLAVRAKQTITFNAPVTQRFVSGASFDVFASSDAGLLVTLVSTSPNVCSVLDNSVVLMRNEGVCELTASQAGNDNVSAAVDVNQQVVLIGKSDQSIVFNAPTEKIFVRGASFSVFASSNSGLPVTLIATNREICTVFGTTVTMHRMGTCELIASQTGNDLFNGAESVRQSIALGGSANVVNDNDGNNNGITDLIESVFGTNDIDGDGIPDALENLLDRNVTAFTDTDGDGMPDVAEIMIGRDPNNNDNAITRSPVITITNSRVNLAAKGVMSAYRLNELTVSAIDSGTVVIPETYFKKGACANAVPYNYKVVCNKVPNSGYVSGVQKVWWLITDGAGNWGRNEQTLNILPQVNFEFDSQVLSADTNNGSIAVRLILSGDTVTSKAFTLPFRLSGSAQVPLDYDLVKRQFQFQPNERRSKPIKISLGSAPTDGAELVLTLDLASAFFTQPDTAINPETQFVTAGEKLSQRITIVQNRLFPPRLANFKGTQNASRGRLFDKKRGNITFSFDLIDPDGGDYTFSWLNSDDALFLTSGERLSHSTDAAPILDVSTLASGRYFIEVQVFDKTSNSSAVISAIISIIGGITLPAHVDSDQDGIADNLEGFGDKDGDGIPDYLDAQNNQANVIPSENGNRRNFLVRAEAGLRLLFGKTATAANRSGINISLADLASNGANGQRTTNSALPDVTLSRIFDYEIEGIDVPFDPNDKGHHVAIIFPLVKALRADSDFFKYDANGWHHFSEDSDNYIEWADFENGIRGNCPETSSTAYTRDSSQKAGKNCLKLTIQDGGANDADGVVDGRIVDPLGIATPNLTVSDEATPTVVEPIDNSVRMSGGGGSFDFLLFFLLFSWSILLKQFKNMRWVVIG